jgi:hypothetical protein
MQRAERHRAIAFDHQLRLPECAVKDRADRPRDGAVVVAPQQIQQPLDGLWRWPRTSVDAVRNR